MGKRLIVQRRGRGFGRYRSPAHQHLGEVRHPPTTGRGEIVEILHERGRIAPLARVRIGPIEHLQIAHDGATVGQQLSYGSGGEIAAGNTMELGSIPEGTMIYNIESQPGDGGKFVRSSGNAATVVSQGARTTILLPSGRFRDFHPRCRATIGLIAGGGHVEKPFAKSGKKFHAYTSRAKAYFKVRGVAMNPVSHPHGGGSHQHVGTQSSVGRNTPPGRKVGRLAPKRRPKTR